MQNYSFLADLLNKFHTSPLAVQILGLLCIVTIIALLFWMVRDITVTFIRRKSTWSDINGAPLYTAYMDDELGQVMLYHHVKAENPKEVSKEW